MSQPKRGRPFCPRKIGRIPEVTYFKPRGIPLQDMDVVAVSYEELEAIRLVDYLDYEQEDAAAEMNVSRRTFARDLNSGRKKVADALINGKALEIMEDRK